jgi:glycosyltransferase involved in cell wall biosynthesis
LVGEEVEDAHLVIIGPDYEGYQSRVEDMISQLDLGRRVTFTGVLTGQNKINALAAADVAVFPAYTETFGFSALEAMACCTPVVISSGASLSSEAALAGAAFVSSPEPRLLAATILRVLRDPGSARAVGAIGERMVRNRFSWEHVTPEFIRLYTAAATANIKPLGRF